MAVRTHDTASYTKHQRTQSVLIGAAGSGKTTALLQEAASLAMEHGGEERLPIVITSSRRSRALLKAPMEEYVEFGHPLPLTSTPYDFARSVQETITPESPRPATLIDRVTLLVDRAESKQRIALKTLGAQPTHAVTRLAQRIDRLKRDGVDATGFTEQALAVESGDRSAEKDRAFAELFLWHDEELKQRGWIDREQLILDVKRRLETGDQATIEYAASFPWLLVDEFEEFSISERGLVLAFAALTETSRFALDDDQATRVGAASGERLLAELRAVFPDLLANYLESSYRLGNQTALAAKTVAEKIGGRLSKQTFGTHADFVEFWQSSTERAQALAVADAIDRSLANGELDRPEDVVVVVRSSEREGTAVCDALSELGIPYTTLGEYNPFRRREVRDLLAWIRLLTDPTDSGAVTRALARPPMSVSSIDIARTVQIARRRKIDMISALSASLESPQIAPESRERIRRFLRLHKSALSALDAVPPQRFISRMIEHLGLRGDFAFSARADTAIRQTSLNRLVELAGDFANARPLATARDFSGYFLTAAESDGVFGPSAWQIEPQANRVDVGVRVLPIHAVKGTEAEHAYVIGLDGARLPGPRSQLHDAVPNTETKNQSRARHEDSMRKLFYLATTRARRKLVLSYAKQGESGTEQKPAPYLIECLKALEGSWKQRDESALLPDENVNEVFALWRDSLISDLAKVGRGLSELRFDTDLDLSSSVVRYLELVKLAALKVRPQEQDLAESIDNVNQRLMLAMTNEQRELFTNSGLDRQLVAGTAGRSLAPRATKPEELSLDAFLPTSGGGLVLSASDLELYRSCPLRYKFARVFKLPQEQTPNQRFGIVVHNALERFHADDNDGSISTLLELLESGWRRAGFTDNEEDNRYHAMAEEAMAKYLQRLQSEKPEIVYTERSFSFPLGNNTVRGRVDRVDRLSDGSYELIDYKTGRPRRQADLKDDIQLSLYALAAREAWGVDAGLLTYYYLIDDVKVPVPTDEIADGWIEESVERIGANIKAQEFEPTPSFASCSICAYKIACPAAEA